MDEGLRRTEMALEMAERDGLLDVLAYALDTKGIILAARGRLDRVRDPRAGRACRISQEQNLPSATVIAGNAGATLEEADRPEAALAMYEQGETSSRRLGDRRGADVQPHVAHPGAHRSRSLGRGCGAAVAVRRGRRAPDGGVRARVHGHAQHPLPARVAGRPRARQQLSIRRWSRYLVGQEAEVRADLKAAHALLLNAAGQHEAALAEAEQGLAESLDPSFPLSARRAAPQAAEAAFALGRLDKVEELIDGGARAATAPAGSRRSTRTSRAGRLDSPLREATMGPRHRLSLGRSRPSAPCTGPSGRRSPGSRPGRRRCRRGASDEGHALIERSARDLHRAARARRGSTARTPPHEGRPSSPEPRAPRRMSQAAPARARS